MSEAANHVVVARSVYDAFERGGIDAVYPLLAPDVLWGLTGYHDTAPMVEAWRS